MLETPDAPVKLSATGVSAEFFQTLGAQPMLGRLFRAEDDVPNAAPTVIVSHKLWRTHLNADPAIVGKPLRLVDGPPGPPVIIIGVMPAAFDFPRGTDLWIPVVPVLANASANDKIDALEAIGVLFVLGRLREGVTPASAASQLDAIVRGIRAKAAASGKRTPGVQNQATPPASATSPTSPTSPASPKPPSPPARRSRLSRRCSITCSGPSVTRCGGCSARSACCC